MHTHEPNPITSELPLRSLSLKEHKSDPYFSEPELVALTGSRIEMGAAETALDYQNGIAIKGEYDESRALTKNALKIVDGLDPEATLHEQVNGRLARVKEQLERGVDPITTTILEKDRTALELVRDTYNYLSITGPQMATTHLKGVEAATAKRNYVNECIRQHNEFIARNPAEVQDTSQPVLTPPAPAEADPHDPVQETTNARERVASSFQPTTGQAAPENPRTKETPNEKLLEDILTASRGTTLIHTDMPPSGPVGSRRKFNREGMPSDSVRTGFQTVGDEVGASYSPINKSGILNMPGTPMAVEGVFYNPLQTPIYEEQAQAPVRSGLFGKKTVPPPVRVKTGEQPIMMANPISGQQERAVEVTYQFNSQDYFFKAPIGDTPTYRTQSGRGGNMLIVQVKLPQSIANAMIAEVERNPQFARIFAERLTVSDRTGFSAEDWNGKPDKLFKVKPPYDTLPAGWTLSVYNEAAGTETKAAF